MKNQDANENINSSLLSLDEILCATDGKFIGGGRENFFFSSVVTDSRNVKENSLFVPLEGEFQDGHGYIEQALEKGAKVIFVSKKSYGENEERYGVLCKKYPDTAFILVENTLTALQKIAGKYVEKFPELIKISITGSSGKTTTKEIAQSVLSKKFNVICNRGNLNSETGLPLSCFEIRKEHQVAVLEMGMNRKNEIGELCETFKPQYGIITNIGTAHIGRLGSRDNIAEEKKKIFLHIPENGAAIIPGNDDYAEFLAAGVKGKVIFYGQNDEKGIEFVKDNGIEGCEFKLNGKPVHFKLPGIYNYYNALGVIELAEILGLSTEEIAAGLEDVKPLSGRSCIRKGNYTILEDCYNANPDSMEKAVEFVSDLDFTGKKILVLGDMLELGENSKTAHEKIGRDAVSAHVQMIVFIGREMEFAWKEAEKNNTSSCRMEYFSTYTDSDIALAARHIKDFASSGDFILLKASHGIALDRLILKLEENFTGEK